MNPEPNEKIVWHFGIVFVAACFLFVALTAIVKFSVSVPTIDADRAAVRSKDLAEIRAAENTALTAPGWVDKDRGIVRLPIDEAMQIYEQAAQNPAAARADLMARAKKAAAPLPKKAAAPNPFE
jgi:hypothetical protein